MSYFNSTFLEFFKELSKNNNTEWFNDNRKTYEKEVKKPFAAFVEEMISRINKYEPEVQLKPGDTIMRINNDIRFSKDKTPYKTHMAANISKYGKKDKSYPGFYFQISPAGINMFGGTYMPAKDHLEKIRTYIGNHQKEFSKVYNDKEFKDKFGYIQGEQNKRIPPEFKETVEKEPMIANKQFYYTAELKPALITTAELPDELMEYYKAGKNVNEFLKTAIK